MSQYYIFKNEKKIEKVIVTLDTDKITAFGNWLDDNGYEGQYEMIETNDESNFYVEIGTDYFEIKDEEASYA